MGLLICKNGLIWAWSGCSIELKFHQHQDFTILWKSNDNNWNLNWRMKVKCRVPILWSIRCHNQTIQSHPNFTNTHSLPCSSHPMVGLWIWCHFQNYQILDPCPCRASLRPPPQKAQNFNPKKKALSPVIKGAKFYKIIYVCVYVCMYICVGVCVYICNGCLPFLLLLVILRITQIYYRITNWHVTYHKK